MVVGKYVRVEKQKKEKGGTKTEKRTSTYWMATKTVLTKSNPRLPPNEPLIPKVPFESIVFD